MPRGKAAPGDAGTEVDFGKPTPQYKSQTPPFYVVWATPLVHDTCAGLRINAPCQVMDRRGQVIPGLYYGGESAGGCNQHGLGHCTAQGDIAGKRCRGATKGVSSKVFYGVPGDH